MHISDAGGALSWSGAQSFNFYILLWLMRLLRITLMCHNWMKSAAVVSNVRCQNSVFFECFVVMWRTQFKCVCVCHVSDIIFRWQNNNFLYLQRFQFRHIHNFIRVRPSTFLYFINWKSISDESKESENHLIISILCFWTNAFLLRLSHQLQINYRAFALLAISKQIQIVKEVEENK